MDSEERKSQKEKMNEKNMGRTSERKKMQEASDAPLTKKEDPTQKNTATDGKANRSGGKDL